MPNQQSLTPPPRCDGDDDVTDASQSGMGSDARTSREAFVAEAVFARHLLRQRRRREAILGKNMFSEPAWDMLLDLFAAEVEGRRISKSSLVIAAAVPQSTALRWMSDMVNEGQLVRYPDTSDGRRTFISLTERSFRDIALLLRDWVTEVGTLIATL